MANYIITFVDDDNTTILQQEELEEGVLPVYNGETPTKPATAQYTYTFAGWAPQIVEVTEDATYVAAYEGTLRKYNITFVDEDNITILKEATEYVYGTPANAIAKPSNPIKKEDASCTYTFNEWIPTIVSVTGDATYKASYEAHRKSFIDFFTTPDNQYDKYEDGVITGVEKINKTTIEKLYEELAKELIKRGGYQSVACFIPNENNLKRNNNSVTNWEKVPVEYFNEGMNSRQYIIPHDGNQDGLYEENELVIDRISKYYRENKEEWYQKSDKDKIETLIYDLHKGKKVPLDNTDFTENTPKTSGNPGIITTGCNNICTGTCSNTCGGTMAAWYTPELGDQLGCNGGCKTLCLNYCDSKCSSSCGETCGANCTEGCGSGCNDGCTKTVKGGCSDCDNGCKGCTNTCSGSCGKGCGSGCEGNCSGCKNGCISSCKSNCGSNCTGRCGESCDRDCSVNCTGTCADTCATGCYISCSDNCETDCRLHCGTDCGNACENGCKGMCTYSCTGGCSGGCGNGCGKTCSTTCAGTCTGACSEGCEGGCSGCRGGCGSGCSATCGGDSCGNACGGYCAKLCTNQCQNNCGTKCTDACKNSCQTYCNDSCKSTNASSSSVNISNDATDGCGNACTTGCNTYCTGCSGNCAGLGSGSVNGNIITDGKGDIITLEHRKIVWISNRTGAKYTGAKDGFVSGENGYNSQTSRPRVVDNNVTGGPPADDLTGTVVALSIDGYTIQKEGNKVKHNPDYPHGSSTHTIPS